MRRFQPEYLRYRKRLPTLGLLIALLVIPSSALADTARWTDEAVAISAIVSLALSVALTGSTILLWLATKRLAGGAEAQAVDFKKSIAESARAAEAMEEVARHMATSANAAADSVATMKERTAQQMRAYVTVQVGSGATFQERNKNLYFEVRPHFLNIGATPARNVRFRARAEVLPLAALEDFKFPLDVPERGGATLFPQQHFVASTMTDHFVPDQDVETIKATNGQGLIGWGHITYDDIFGESHETKFAILIQWMTDGSIFGHWAKNFNDAT
jgi:hypothetical protein